MGSTVFAGEESLKISHLTNKIVENIHKMFDVQVTVHCDTFLYVIQAEACIRMPHHTSQTTT